ncbi:NUDIX hydrolase [Nonomuraea sp. NPDC050790]|uniref:NUDIX hydrolase n=1 Tax=Nonomuraea sp. NPDC050790 TaxID=3364371 RepID=UPI0037BBADA0
MNRRRLAAYGMIVRGEEILLAHYVHRETRHWTLPGGGVEHGEDPYDAVVREVEEETGYTVVPEVLIGVDSYHPEPEFHAVRLFWEARVVGGDLRFEVGGSTDRAAWFPLEQVTGLERSEVVDRGLELLRARPKSGHL